MEEKMPSMPNEAPGEDVTLSDGTVVRVRVTGLSPAKFLSGPMSQNPASSDAEKGDIRSIWGRALLVPGPQGTIRITDKATIWEMADCPDGYSDRGDQTHSRRNQLLHEERHSLCLMALSGSREGLSMSKPKRRGMIRCFAWGLWSGRYRFTMHGPDGDWVSVDEPSVRLAMKRWRAFRKVEFR